VSVACYDKLGPAIVTNPTYSRATPASRLHRLTPDPIYRDAMTPGISWGHL